MVRIGWLLTMLLLLAGCTVKTDVKEDIVIANEEPSLDELLQDEKYVHTIYGELFTATSLAELESILATQLVQFDQQIGVIYKGQNLSPENVEQLLTKLKIEHDMIGGTLFYYEFAVVPIEQGFFLDLFSRFTTNKIEMASILPKRDTLLSSLQLEGKSEREQLEAIHRAVIEGMDYNFEYDDLVRDHSPAGFFLYGTGVCQAYASAMHMLLVEAGFEAKLVYGELKSAIANDEKHMWNLVKVDGKWRHVDATSNDRGAGFANQVSKVYFMLTDEQLSATHIWQEADYPRAN
ncbi:transglutaminase-like domain-containing protein [Lysinibacillus louembei]|uniref:Transglutaminase-like domain-containing protein n=1 Tax=Lysinibacillus louembei TaxID=1470088 RepID=A0ABZ0RRV8_9BACI|nr:transglutaminase-like domain-containing protein [Lysinibacillus louembei]WPK10963.1 transglutaminase-like domain-containing protein [Lysinibacillus louembei]